MTTLRVDPWQEIPKGQRSSVWVPQNPYGGPVWYSEADKLDLDTDIERFVLRLVNGTKKLKNLNIAEIITDGEIEQTMEGASSIKITCFDPDGELRNRDELKHAIEVNFDGLWYKLAGVEKQGEFLTLTFEDRVVSWLRNAKKPRRGNRRKLTRLEFCLMLVRMARRKSPQIRCVIPELSKKQPIEKLGKSEKLQLETTHGGLNNEEEITVKNQRANATQISVLESVLQVGNNQNLPDKLLLAAIITVIQESVAGLKLVSSDNMHVGAFHQDIAVNSVWKKLDGSHRSTKPKDVRKDAKAFYIQARKVYESNRSYDPAVIALLTQRPGGGPEQYRQHLPEAKRILKAFNPDFNGTATVSYRKRYMFSTEKNGKAQNYWDSIGDLLSETKFRRFVSNGILYLISEEQLMKGKKRMILSERTPGVQEINFNMDVGKPVDTANVICRIQRWAAPPGTVIELKNCGAASKRWLVSSIRRNLYGRDAEITLKSVEHSLPEPTPDIAQRSENILPGIKTTKKIRTVRGAKGIVEGAAAIAIEVGRQESIDAKRLKSPGKGPKKAALFADQELVNKQSRLFVVSAYRPGSTVGGGSLSDHAFNDANRAARDIARRGVNAITGPPSPWLDRAVVAIGQQFGRDYGDGAHRIVDTFNWRGYRIQIIWRTPEYGGHMGHIHIGARKL